MQISAGSAVVLDVRELRCASVMLQVQRVCLAMPALTRLEIDLAAGQVLVAWRGPPQCGAALIRALHAAGVDAHPATSPGRR